MSTSTNPQYDTHIISDGASGAIITWGQYDYYAQRLDSSGNALWNGDVHFGVDNVPNRAYQPVSDGSGGFLVGFDCVQAADNQHDYLCFQHVSGTGTLLLGTNGVTFLQSPQTAPNLNALFTQVSTVSDGSGGAIVAWDDSLNTIYAQHLNIIGTTLWGSSGVVLGNEPDSSKGLSVLQITSDGSHGLIAGWNDGVLAGPWENIYAQHVDSSGTLQWGTNGVTVATGSTAGVGYALSSDEAGGAIFMWFDGRDSTPMSTNSQGIYASRISASGTALWAVNGIPVTHTDAPFAGGWSSAVVPDGTHGGIFVWQAYVGPSANLDVYAQHVSANAPVRSAYVPSGIYAFTASSTIPMDWSQLPITWSATVPATTSLSFFTRLLATNSFDTSDVSSVVNGDTFNGTSHADVAQSIIATSSILTFSNLSGGDGNGWAYYIFQSGKPANYYPAGSIVRARVRIHSVGVPPYLALITEGWNGSQATLTTADQWTTIQYTETVPFANPALYWDTPNPDFDPSDYVLVDWVQVEPPLNFTDWDPVVGGTIPTTGLGGYLQYKALFGTNDSTISPSLHSVTIGSNTNPPTITTSAASNISSTTATLNANITDIGGSAPTTRGFAWGTNLFYGATTSENGSFSTGAFLANLPSLACSTNYDFLGYATNGGGIGYGSNQSFSTSPCPSVPSLSSQAASAISDTSATLNGSIDSIGSTNPTLRGFVYGTTSAFGATTTESGSFTSGSFSTGISSLTCGTTHHFASYATNDTGTSYGGDTVFVTNICISPTPGGNPAITNGPIVGTITSPVDGTKITNSPNSILSSPRTVIFQRAGTTMTVVAKTIFRAGRGIGGDVVTIAVSGPSVSSLSLPIVDNHDGTYSAPFTFAQVGTYVITATINGAAVGQDTDGVSDGVFHLTVDSLRGQQLTEPQSHTAMPLIALTPAKVPINQTIVATTSPKIQPLATSTVVVHTPPPALSTVSVPETHPTVHGPQGMTSASLNPQTVASSTTLAISPPIAITPRAVIDNPIQISLPNLSLPAPARDAIQAVGAVVGLASFSLAVSGIPFSATDPWRVAGNMLNSILLLSSSRKRKRAWGTVYDSVTKEPLDPAYVQLFDTSGTEVTTALTDLDGRYGFLAKPGTYTITAAKTHYQFPSTLLAGRDHDILYQDIYTGGQLVVGPDGAINRNIPLDPLEKDWNQLDKRHNHRLRYVTYLDPYLLIFFDTLFFGGMLFTCWEAVTRHSLWTIVFAALYALLLIVRLWKGRPHLYGTVKTAEGLPLAYGTVRFFNEVGVEHVAKVIDEYGRYFALLAPGIYRTVVEIRTGPEELTPIYEGIADATDGVANEDLVVIKV